MSASDKKKLRKEQKTAALTEKQKQELKEAKTLKAYTLTFVVVMALVVAIVLGVSVRSPIVGAINKNTVAINIGESPLNTVELTYYYMDTIYAYYTDVYNKNYSSWGNYWVWMLGFNTDTPLDEQFRDKENTETWAAYFLEESIISAKSIYALFEESKAKDHHMTEAETKALNEELSGLNNMASYYGYSNAEAFLRSYYCDGADLESYSAYKAMVAQANSYAKSFSDSLEYTQEEIRGYEKGKFNNYSSFTYAFYKVDYEDYLKDGVQGENGKFTYTDEQIAAAKEAAKLDAVSLLNQAPKTEKDFNLAIRALEVNKNKESAACTMNKDVFYGSINASLLDESVQKWMGNSNTKELDIKSFDIYDYSKNDDGTVNQDVTGYYIVLLLDRNDNYTNIVSMNYAFIEYTGGYYNSNYELQFSDSSKQKGKEEADALLKEWAEGEATRETFVEMVKKNTDDKEGDPEGFYEDIYPGATQDNIDAWLFEEGRKEGDTTVIQDDTGCYIIYFNGEQDETFRDYMIKQDLIAEDAKEWLEKLIDDIGETRGDLSGIEYDLVIDYWY